MADQQINDQNHILSTVTAILGKIGDLQSQTGQMCGKLDGIKSRLDSGQAKISDLEKRVQILEKTTTRNVTILGISGSIVVILMNGGAELLKRLVGQ